MQSEKKNSANTITIHNNTWFQCPRELPHSSATSQPPALPHSLNLMLGGREGGQVRVGSGLCQGSAGDPEGLLQGKASILWRSAFFTVQLSHPYMTTGKTIALTRWTFVGKVMSLLFEYAI